jgi:hypothetical protein
MDLKGQLWVIAAIIYVGGMFPLFYVYQTQPLERFGTLATSLTYISIFAAVGILFIHIWLGAWGKDAKAQSS